MPPEPAPTPPTVLILGSVQVPGVDGGHSEPHGARAQALIVALALARGRVVPAAQLVEDLWDEPPADPKAALHNLVSRLRRICVPGTVASRTGGYALGIDSDLDQATRAAVNARAALRDGHANEAITLAQQARNTWRTGALDLHGIAPAVADELDTTSRSLAAALDALLLDAAETAARHDLAIDIAYPRFAADPTDETAARALINAYAATRRTGQAIRVFADLRHALAVEFGTDPAPDLVTLAAGLADDEATAPKGSAVQRYDPERGESGSTRSPAATHAAPTPDGTAPTGTSDDVGHETDTRTQPDRRTVLGVPAAVTDLIGREGDITAIHQALAASRLVTIVGPGGLGKTSLAYEVARRDTHTPMIAVVELAAVRSGKDIGVTLADSLGIPSVYTGRIGDLVALADLRTLIISRLQVESVLLIVDNCEHVADDAAAWIDDLLAAAPGLRVCATSRSPLRILGEHVHQPQTLGVDFGTGPAVQLFCERAHAARPTAELPIPVISRLCERLDGLPLAIELAAARMRTMTAVEIETNLAQRFALLTSSQRGIPDRHRTLEAVIEWSWNLLGDVERDLASRLAIWPDAFGIDAAQAVAPALDQWQVVEAIDALVGQSLLVVREDNGTMRYRMLETVREYGSARRAEAGVDADVLDGVFAWAVAVCEQVTPDLLGTRQIEVLHRMRYDQENLMFAFRQATEARRPGVVVQVFLALAGGWILRGSEDHALGLVPGVMDAVRGWDVPDDLVNTATLALTVAAVAGLFGDAGSTGRAIGRIRRLARRETIGPRTAAVAGLFSLRTGAERNTYVGQLRASDDPYIELLGLFLSAQGDENAGELDGARRWAALGYQRAEALGDVAARSFSATLWASSASEAGDWEAVGDWVRRAREGLDTFDHMGQVTGRRVAEVNLLQLDWLELSAAVSGGNLTKAKQLYSRILAAVGDGAVDTQISSMIAMSAAEICALEGDLGGAVRHYCDGQASLQARPGPGTSGAFDPWAYILNSAYLLRLLHSTIPGAQHVAATLASDTFAVRSGRPVYADLPMLGAVSLALGAYFVMVADDETDAAPSTEVREFPLAVRAPGEASPRRSADLGIELVSLAEAMGSRQDLPSLRRDVVWQKCAAVLGADAVAAAQARAAALRARIINAGPVVGVHPIDADEVGQWLTDLLADPHCVKLRALAG